MARRRGPPEVCPECGAEGAYRARYTTGGGWRVAFHECANCGREHRV